MANFLTLLHFYFRLWHKKDRLILGLIQVHLTILLFSFAFPKYLFLAIPLVFTFLIQLFYSDWESKNDFFSVLNIPLIERFYVKIFLLSLITLTFLAHFNLRATGTIALSQIVNQITLFGLAFGFFYFIRSKLISILIFIAIFVLASILTKELLVPALLRGSLAIVFLIGNVIVYYSALRHTK